MRSRPNVVLIVVDTLRADHLGCYGYTRPTSPHLDGLARRGVRFANAHAASSWTAASVASILTGLYPAVHGVEQRNSVLAASVATLAENFNAAGYATAAFSANPVFVRPELGFGRGFDSFQLLHGGPVEATERIEMIPIDPGFQHFVKVAKADVVTDAVLAWRREHRGQPSFLFVHYIDPHADYFPPPEYARRFGVSDDAPLAGVAQRPLLRSFTAPAAADLATLIGLYDGEIAFADDHIGRLLSVLTKEPASTLIVLTADHGEEFGDHGGLAHGRTLWEEQLRVPLILAGLDIPAGRVVTEPVSLVSLWATIADLTHLMAPPPNIGHSLSAALYTSPVAAAPLFADLQLSVPGIPRIHSRTILADGWKLVADINGGLHLFNLAQDPQEQQALDDAQDAHFHVLEDLLGSRDAAAQSARRHAAPGTTALSPEVRARMEALGYGQ